MREIALELTKNATRMKPGHQPPAPTTTVPIIVAAMTPEGANARNRQAIPVMRAAQMAARIQVEMGWTDTDSPAPKWRKHARKE
ncbi:MAG: hypothetical protein M9909_09550 [Thermomicrobiales bacterium]|nr:hypothetical protein [Thermomicrobiales bacterium]